MLYAEKREAPRRLTHRTLCNALIICKLGGGTSESTMEYFALTDGWSKDLDISFFYLCYLVKATTSGEGVVIAPLLLAKIINDNNNVDPIAVAIDMSLIVSIGGAQGTIKDVILGSGITEESLAKYRITKEQFYSLE